MGMEGASRSPQQIAKGRIFRCTRDGVAARIGARAVA